ncbi:hypothetical protein OF829_11920 [Sphingomonas sp. LB-2]|uniref:hypothetical protein n=1 Tax=Sphingomonas caeni TaxID=2984949 RepID=UPI00222E78DA|nr:hypothetical protein [Sphingomonas caeni]MCW3847948.1 hypothetical protein [Sphingomonas caeni]
MSWHLTLPGALVLFLMFAMLLAGLHMIVRPDFYVGCGPIPARSAANVRAMGVMFALLGGAVTAFFTLPILLS